MRPFASVLSSTQNYYFNLTPSTTISSKEFPIMSKKWDQTASINLQSPVEFLQNKKGTSNPSSTQLKTNYNPPSCCCSKSRRLLTNGERSNLKTRSKQWEDEAMTNTTINAVTNGTIKTRHRNPNLSSTSGGHNNRPASSGLGTSMGEISFWRWWWRLVKYWKHQVNQSSQPQKRKGQLGVGLALSKTG